jgi:hypothetical protein
MLWVEVSVNQLYRNCLKKAEEKISNLIKSKKVNLVKSKDLIDTKRWLFVKTKECGDKDKELSNYKETACKLKLRCTKLEKK